MTVQKGKPTEEERFEEWAKERGWNLTRGGRFTYESEDTENLWVGWRVRAALADAPAPRHQPDEPKFEDWAKRHNFGSMRPEGDGWGWDFEPSEEARLAYDELVLAGVPPTQDELWLEFNVSNLCSLCGQVGIIDTRGIRTPANFECGGLHYCICPNGRALKEKSIDKAEWFAMQNRRARPAAQDELKAAHDEGFNEAVELAAMQGVLEGVPEQAIRAIRGLRYSGEAPQPKDQ